MAFRDGLSWLELFGGVVLSYNSGLAIYQSRGDLATISLVAFAYFNIVSLFACLKLLQGPQSNPANPSRRDGLRASVWILTMSLTFGFVYQIMRNTTTPTPQVALLLWAMPAATAIAVFILFRQEDRSQTPDEELLDVV